MGRRGPPGRPHVARGLGRAVDGLWVVATLGAGATGAPAPPDWSLPADPDAYAGLGVVQVTGRAPWLPTTAPRHRVAANRRGAWLTADRDDRPATRVPLEELAVAAAAPAGRGRRRRHADARWTLSVTGPASAVELSGAWLALAFLGHLADWPEPV